MRLKIVPNDKPNSEGRWIKVPDQPGPFRRSFMAVLMLYKDHIPADHHVVAYDGT